MENLIQAFLKNSHRYQIRRDLSGRIPNLTWFELALRSVLDSEVVPTQGKLRGEDSP